MAAIRTRGLAAALVATAVVTLVTGCSGDPDAGPSPADGPTTGATGGPVASGSATPADPTPTDPTVTPATGGRISTPLLSMRFPEGWTVSRGSAPSVYGARSPNIWDNIHYSTIGLIRKQPLGQVADLFSDPIGWDRAPRRLPTVTVDGVRMFHLRGRLGGRSREVYGTQRGRSAVLVEFEVADPRERRETIESVLASIDWKPL